MICYLDNAATTLIDPRVLNAMMPYFSNHYGNPSSSHEMAEEPRRAIENAKVQVAALIHADPEHIYFCNSATEANNIIIKGRLAHFLNPTPKYSLAQIITTNTEHISIVESIKWCIKCSGLFVKNTHVQDDGNIDYEELEYLLQLDKHICYNNILLTIIGANNEIGTIHDLGRIGELAAKYKVLFHTDITQLVGKVFINVNEMNIFAATFSGHKLYGPKGVGVLYCRDIKLLNPIISGGFQNKISSGTQNVPAIVGMGKACEIIKDESTWENVMVRGLRDRMYFKLKASIPNLIVNGTLSNRLYNNLNISIPEIKNEVFIKGMNDVIVAGGSACHSNDIDPSPVLLAIHSKFPENAIRLTLGRYTTEKEVDYACNRIIQIVKDINA